MNSNIKKIKKCLQPYPKLKQAILFGSLAEGREHFNSDVDIAIQLDHPMSATEKTVLMRMVAQVTGRPVDLIDLETVGQPLLMQIIQHGKRLLGENAAYGRLISQCVFDNADYSPYRQRILDARRQAWIGL